MMVGDEDASMTMRVEDARSLFQRDPGIWFSATRISSPGILETRSSRLMEDTPKVRLEWGTKGINPIRGAERANAAHRGRNWRIPPIVFQMIDDLLDAAQARLELRAALPTPGRRCAWESSVTAR